MFFLSGISWTHALTCLSITELEKEEVGMCLCSCGCLFEILENINKEVSALLSSLLLILSVLINHYMVSHI